ncbi:endonuclease NucS domain-containing protein [Pseudomonas syringae]
MNKLESKIRDYLSDNLELIEKGLMLIKKEFPLENSHGAGGSIDILAKDKLGHYVVIEIKRSD